ncbi:hypothetical protein [Miniphocaeibacter massiliensis]|nr:hypothetical protein [Miniphocaeibacter massiliensis]
MDNCVISGSSKFQEEYIKWIEHFNEIGYRVIDYPKLSNNIRKY